MAKAKKAVRKKVTPKVKKVEAIKKVDSVEAEHVAVKPEISAKLSIEETPDLNLSGKYTGDANQTPELPSINTATKPVTLTGKTVSISATGKVMLFNPKINKIITGLIDASLAKKIIADFPHIEILKNGKRD